MTNQQLETDETKYSAYPVKPDLVAEERRAEFAIVEQLLKQLDILKIFDWVPEQTIKIFHNLKSSLLEQIEPKLHLQERDIRLQLELRNAFIDEQYKALTVNERLILNEELQVMIQNWQCIVKTLILKEGMCDKMENEHMPTQEMEEFVLASIESHRFNVATQQTIQHLSSQLKW